MECLSLNEFAVWLFPPADPAGLLAGSILIRYFLKEFLCFIFTELFMMLWNI